MCSGSLHRFAPQTSHEVKGLSFEERKAKREEQLASLKEALCSSHIPALQCGTTCTLAKDVVV